MARGQALAFTCHRRNRCCIAFLALQGSSTPIWLKLPKGESSSPWLSTGECVLNLTSEETAQLHPSLRVYLKPLTPGFAFLVQVRTWNILAKVRTGYWGSQKEPPPKKKNRSHTLKSRHGWESWVTASVSSWAGIQPLSWTLSQYRVLFWLYLFYKIFFPFCGKTLEARIIKTTHLCMSYDLLFWQQKLPLIPQKKAKGNRSFTN